MPQHRALGPKQLIDNAARFSEPPTGAWYIPISGTDMPFSQPVVLATTGQIKSNKRLRGKTSLGPRNQTDMGLFIISAKGTINLLFKHRLM